MTLNAQPMKSFDEVMRTICEGKGNLRDIYDQNSVPPTEPPRATERLTPSVLCKKLFCPAFVPKPYSCQPLEKRQEYDILAQMSVLKTILRMTKLGYRFVASEAPAGKFNGRVDLVFQRANEPETKVEVKSSKHLRLWDIVQGILYHDPSTKVAIASINEYLEPEEWLIESVKSAATELNDFIQQFPKEASKIRLPHAKLCIKCADGECPFKKPN
jgi:hypothetical protein